MNREQYQSLIGPTVTQLSCGLQDACNDINPWEEPSPINTPEGAMWELYAETPYNGGRVEMAEWGAIVLAPETATIEAISEEIADKLSKHLETSVTIDETIEEYDRQPWKHVRRFFVPDYKQEQFEQQSLRFSHQGDRVTIRGAIKTDDTLTRDLPGHFDHDYDVIVQREGKSHTEQIDPRFIRTEGAGQPKLRQYLEAHDMIEG